MESGIAKVIATGATATSAYPPKAPAGMAQTRGIL